MVNETKNKGRVEVGMQNEWQSWLDKWRVEVQKSETVAKDFRTEIVQIRKVMVRSAFNLKTTIRNHPARGPTVNDQFRKGQAKKVKFRKRV